MLPLVVFLALAAITAGGHIWRWLACDRKLSVSAVAIDVLASAAAGIALWARNRQTLQTKRHSAAIERLSAVSAAISAKLGSGVSVLEQLSQAAMCLLRTDRAGITILDGQTLRIAAYAGDRPPGSRDAIALAEMPTAARALKDSDVVFVENVADSGGELNRRVAAEFRAGSFILIPLRVEGQLAGVFALSNTHPRRFSRAERQMARLLGSQAAVIIAQHQLHQRAVAALEAQRRIAQQRDAVFAINAEIYEARTVEESLHKVVELAPPVMGVDHCIVGFWEEGEQMLIAAASGARGAAIVGRRFDMRGSSSAWAIQERKACIIQGGDPEHGAQAELRRTFNVQSAVFIPLLRKDQAPLGVLSLVRETPGEFSAEQLALAEQFAARVTGAIEQARLREAAQRDAEHRALLLRELNHRIKNSLAGIVGLLSLQRPELSPSASQWMDRAIERIRTMARAHGVFSDGMSEVSLHKLIDAVVPSLSVLKRPGIELRVQQTDAANVFLEPQQTISLAMVLHELCANAIVHGLASGEGSLVLRVRAGADNAIAIDVIDCAVGSDEPAAAQTGDLPAWAGNGHVDGIGLQLVRELVGRELMGKFCLRRHGGGTIATVEFVPAPQGRQGAVV